MATVTPASFRSAIRTRTRWSSSEVTDAEIDEAGKAAFNAAFPYLYQKVRTAAATVSQNSTTGYGTVTVADSSLVYGLTNPDIDQEVTGWEFQDSTTIRRIPSDVTSVDVYTIAPYDYPTVSVTVPNQWVDALYTYAEFALVEMMLNDFSNFRGIKLNSRDEQIDDIGLGNHLTNLYNKWQRMVDERAMTLPVVRV